MFRVKIHRMTCEGEQVDVEIEVPKHEMANLGSFMAPAFALTDQRLQEMNWRLLHAFKTLEHFPPECRGAIKVLVDSLHHGRADALGTIPTLLKQGQEPASEGGPNG